MSAVPAMKIPLVLAVLALLAAPLEAQVGTKKRSNKGSGARFGKKSRVTGSVFDQGNDGGSSPTNPAAGASSAAPGEARIRLGDRVRGTVGPGATQRAVFEAVKGTRLTVKITPADRKLTLAARLLDPSGAHLLTPSAKEGDPAVLRVDDFVCPRTGPYTIEVSFASSQAGDYLVETHGDHPDGLDRELVVAGRRPSRITLAGIDRRTLSKLKVRALDGDELDLWVQLVDPDGVSLPLDGDTWRSSDGRTVLVSRVPLERNGDYVLSIMERDDVRTRVEVEVEYDDAGPTRKLYEL